MMGTDTAPSRNGLLPLWFGMLGPPVIWAARLTAGYALVPFACAQDAMLLLQGLTLAALLGTAFAGLVAWRRWKAAGRTLQVEFGGVEARTRFMALTGMLSSGYFLLVIAAEGLSNFFIDPCLRRGPWL